ncbi:MAG: hypothetical protein M1818_006420, partial [Claussenomyces sp. TS43310]
SSLLGMLSIKDLIPLIDRYIEGSGGLEALSPTLEGPRFALLRDACKNDDWFYVVLHEMFCTWSLNRQILLDIKALNDAQGMALAFQILGQLIRENDSLSLNHLHWFATFPSPLPNIVARSEPLSRMVPQVARFLHHLARKWVPLMAKCQQRGYPPLVDELLADLNLLSPVLQVVFFTATRRNMGISDDEYGAQMERLFATDRKTHRELSARFNTASPPTENEIKERNAWLVNNYRSISNQRLESSRRGAQPWPTHLVPGPPAPSATPVIGQSAHMSPAGPHQISSSIHQHPNTNLTVQNTLLPAAARESFTGIPNVGQVSAAGQFSHSGIQPHGLGSRDSVGYNPTIAPQQGNGHLQYAQAPMLRSNGDDGLPSGRFISASDPSPLSPSVPDQRTLSATQQQQMQPLLMGRMSEQRNDIAQVVGATPAGSSPAPARPNNVQATTARALPAGTISNPLTTAINSSSNTLPPHPQSVQAGIQAPGDNSRRSNAMARATSNALFPPQNYVSQGRTTVPRPEISALHQAHLRSPNLVAFDSNTGQSLPPSERMYQAIKGFAIEPLILSGGKALSKFEFSVSDSLFSRLARDRSSGRNSTIREVTQNSIQFRVRCIKSSCSASTIKPSEWVVADCAWPPTLFLELNGYILEIRRKLHYGKDLPIDVTPYILSSVNNTINRLHISLLSPESSTNNCNVAFAVEIVEVLHHKQIFDGCLSNQRIRAQDTLDNIKATLSGSMNDDDDIAMVSSDLTLDLTDPFMAKIFNIPVRGCGCLHRECFDLETFLMTRNSKPKRSRQISLADVWKCPLCGMDARPYSLRVDDFLILVREKLANDGLLDCKAILISEDGTWRPKPESLPSKRSASRARLEDHNDEGDHKMEEGGLRSSRSMSQVQGEAHIEVIDLDD